MVRFLFSGEGRASRADAWRSLAPLQLVLCTAVAIDLVYRPAPLPAASLAVGTVFLWPGVALAMKRFHDCGLSGWWMLWLLLAGATGFAAALMDIGPLAAWGGRFAAVGCGLTALALLYVSRGDAQANDFGAPPNEAQAGDERASSPRADLPRTNHFQPDPPKPLRVSFPMISAAVRRPDRPCRPVPQTFKGMKSQVASLFEPAPLPPGARATFGRRGE